MSTSDPPARLPEGDLTAAITRLAGELFAQAPGSAGHLPPVPGAATTPPLWAVAPPPTESDLRTLPLTMANFLGGSAPLALVETPPAAASPTPYFLQIAGHPSPASSGSPASWGSPALPGSPASSATPASSGSPPLPGSPSLPGSPATPSLPATPASPLSTAPLALPGWSTAPAFPTSPAFPASPATPVPATAVPATAPELSPGLSLVSEFQPELVPDLPAAGGILQSPQHQARLPHPGGARPRAAAGLAGQRGHHAETARGHRTPLVLL